MIPGLGRFPGEGNGNLLQYPCLENPMDGGAWCPWGHKESDTTERLHFHYEVFGASLVAQMVKSLPAMREARVRFLGREDPLEKAMAIHSSTLAWKIPQTEEPATVHSVPKSWTRLSMHTVS